jgi:hypothetical protein
MRLRLDIRVSRILRPTRSFPSPSTRLCATNAIGWGQEAAVLALRSAGRTRHQTTRRRLPCTRNLLPKARSPYRSKPRLPNIRSPHTLQPVGYRPEHPTLSLGSTPQSWSPLRPPSAHLSRTHPRVGTNRPGLHGFGPTRPGPQPYARCLWPGVGHRRYAYSHSHPRAPGSSRSQGPVSSTPTCRSHLFRRPNRPLGSPTTPAAHLLDRGSRWRGIASGESLIAGVLGGMTNSLGGSGGRTKR